MKNAMKKLTSLLLVALLLVGMIPFAASATTAGITIDFTIKDTNDKVLVQQVITETAGPFSVGQYYNVRGSADYTPIKYWIKNADTGNDGLTVNADHLVQQDSKVVIKVQYTPKMYTIYSAHTTPYTAYSIKAGDPLLSVLPSTIAKEGHTFDGWFTSAGGQLNANDVATENWDGAVFTPKWTLVGCIECLMPSGHKAGCTQDPNYVPPTQGGSTQGGSSSSNTQTPASKNVTIVVKLNGVEQPGYATTIKNDTTTVANLIQYKVDSNIITGYNFATAWTQSSGYMNKEGVVKAGEKVYIAFTTPSVPSNPSGSTSSGSASNTVSNKFPYNVYLNIYKDTLVGSPDKCIDITNGAALDGVVSLGEVKSVVANYYNANNNYGIGYDGLYLAQGNWVSDYVNDTSKYDSIAAGSLRQSGYVYINVMISNATAKSAYVADSSNPKTGDSIYTAMTVMGISAASLAAVMYLYNKKRQAV